MKPPRSKLRGITRKGIVCETPRFLTLFPLQGNLAASSEESPDWIHRRKMSHVRSEPQQCTHQKTWRSPAYRWPTLAQSPTHFS